MQTDREKQLEYNLSVLKRRDAAIKDVLDMAGHVVMYRFNEDKQSWDRKNVEGSLFVVERTGAPVHQFVVLNRLSSENLVESINEDFQMELTEQFLLYRNAAQEINGIWFYSPTERAAMAELLTSLSTPTDTPGGESAAQPTTAATEPEAAYSAQPVTQPQPSPNSTPANVTQFFNMMQGQQDAPPMPPMPGNGAQAPPNRETLAEAAPPVTQETQAPSMAAVAPAQQELSAAAPSTAAAKTPGDVEALKGHLRTQLQTLLQDDGFMNVLALEYLRQRKAAAAAGNNQKARSSLPQPAAPPVPSHMLSLLQQQGQ